MRVLILGASGLLGHTLFRVLGAQADWNISGTVRNASLRELFPPELARGLLVSGDLATCGELAKVLEHVQPDAVVNCISAPRGDIQEGNFLGMVPTLSLLPQRLSTLCSAFASRLVHISSDAVFSGSKGEYVEDDCADAKDAYGKAKLLGEVRDSHAVSIRTSIVGHGLQHDRGLVDWFLTQEEECTGYTRYVFSGLPTVELARVIRDIIIPNSDLAGVYHVAARPISKFDLLSLIADHYGKQIELVPDDRIAIDRSLSAERFRRATGYAAPEWPELIQQMRADYLSTRLNA